MQLANKASITLDTQFTFELIEIWGDCVTESAVCPYVDYPFRDSSCVRVAS